MRALNTEGNAAGDFDAVWSQVEPVGGWLTRDQARALHDAVLALPPGATVVEIGSHQGRSTLSLALARTDVTVVAIDPFEAGGMFGGPATRAVFEANLERAGVRPRVEHVAERSAAVRSRWRRPVDLVFVDGKHDVLSTLGDLRWADRLPQGGILMVHDSFGSVGVTLALLLRVGLSRGLRYVGRVGSLATFERRRPTRADRLGLVRPLPWFGRNLVVKGLLRLRLHGVARLLGHHDRADPY